jgi:predicted RNase H-like nuclease (RuvC/YqgF family)
MVFQKMHFVVQKSASPLSKKCDKLNRLGVDNWTLTMIDETGQDERITELEHKLKHHDRRIAELKHELDEYKEKYSQLLRTRKKIAGLCSAEASPRKLSRLAD